MDSFMNDDNKTILDRSFDLKAYKRKLSNEKLSKTTMITMQPTFQSQFDPDSLKHTLKSKISEISSSPIEYEEIKLYSLTRFFYTYLGGIKFDIDVIGKLHHLICLQKIKYTLSSIELTNLNNQMNELTSQDSYIFQKYKLLSKMLDLCGRLVVKWGIFHSKNYEFRYSGRGLNVKLLDLEKISNSILSIDTFWFAFGVFENPLSHLSEPFLLEAAKLLRHSASELFFNMLSLNNPNPNYKIKEYTAYESLKYKRFNSEVIPEINTEDFKHQSLRFNKGFFSKCFRSDSVLEQIHEKLAEFELVFREFEKELIITLLGSSKYVTLT